MSHDPPLKIGSYQGPDDELAVIGFHNVTAVLIHAPAGHPAGTVDVIDTADPNRVLIVVDTTRIRQARTHGNDAVAAELAAIIDTAVEQLLIHIQRRQHPPSP